jgi:hypothetical protein
MRIQRYFSAAPTTRNFLDEKLGSIVSLVAMGGFGYGLFVNELRVHEEKILGIEKRAKRELKIVEERAKRNAFIAEERAKRDALIAEERAKRDALIARERELMIAEERGKKEALLLLCTMFKPERSGRK